MRNPAVRKIVAEAATRLREDLLKIAASLVARREIAPAIRATLQAIPEPTESLPAEYYDDRLRRAGSGGSRPGSRCAHPSPGSGPESAPTSSTASR